MALTAAGGTRAASDLAASDRELIIHPYLPSSVEERVVMVEGDGCRLRDAEGREYLDATGGLWLAQIGHGRREIAEAAAAQMERLEYFTSFWEFSNDRAIELAERLVSISPPKQTHVYFTSGGSEGNEAALKMARYCALAARGARADLGPRPPAGLPRGRVRLRHGDRLPRLPRGLRADAPPRQAPDTAVALPRRAVRRRGPDRLLPARARAHDRRARRRADRRLHRRAGDGRRRDDRAARRLLAAGRGAAAGERDHLHLRRGGDRLRARSATGSPPSTSASSPTSSSPRRGSPPATRRSARCWSATRSPTRSPRKGFPMGFTYNGHPTSCAVALANLDVIEREGLLERARETGAYILERLRELLDLPVVGEVRGVGMMHAVELVGDRETRAPLAMDAALQDVIRRETGVIVRDCAAQPRHLPATDHVAGRGRRGGRRDAHGARAHRPCRPDRGEVRRRHRLWKRQWPHRLTRSRSGARGRRRSSCGAGR